MKYFTENTFAENKAMHTMLCKRYHPDNQETGNEDMMKEINAEWELYKNSLENPPKAKENMELDAEELEEDFVMYMGVKYTGDPHDISQRVALRFGGMALQELSSSKEYEDYCDRYKENNE